VTRGEGSLPPDRLLTSAEKKKKQVAFTDSPPQTMLYRLPDASPWEPTAWCEMILPGSRQPCLGWALDFQENDTNSSVEEGQLMCTLSDKNGAAAPEKQSLGAVPPQKTLLNKKGPQMTHAKGSKLPC
jgi:hypothetical protein